MVIVLLVRALLVLVVILRARLLVRVLAPVCVPALVVVVVRLEGRALAEGERADARHVGEDQDLRLRQRADALAQPRRQGVADPQDEVGGLQRAGLRRAQHVVVRRRAGRDQQRGRAHPRHHAGRERVDRGDVGDDARGLGPGGRADGEEGDEGAEGHGARFVTV